MPTSLPSHHRPGGGFRNPWPASEPQPFAGLLRWLLYERLVHPRRPDPPRSTFRRTDPLFFVPHASHQTLGVTWVGHSTALLQIGAANVLTDPVWADRASPVRFAGPRRHVPPGISFQALPPLDAVLISHNHYDHLDDLTVRRLIDVAPDVRWLAPLGVAEFLRRRQARNVVELDWWQEAPVGDLTITCTPAQHFSARGIGDRNRTLWASWSVRAPSGRVFFGGDSGYHPDYTTIAQRCGPFDMVLLPIGAYDPRWFMRVAHMNPEEAVQAYLDLRSVTPPDRRTVMVPLHWGTFKLTDEPLDEPPVRAQAAWASAGLPPADLWLLAHGETRTF